MSRFGNLRIPPLGAAMNVAWQTVRQQLPDKTSSSQKQAEKVHFAQVNHTGGPPGPEHHELSSMANRTSWSPTDQGSQEDSFNQGYQSGDGLRGDLPKGQSFASMDMSEDDFVEGRSLVKINEYQAAWNVTNAIQASQIKFSFLDMINLVHFRECLSFRYHLLYCTVGIGL